MIKDSDGNIQKVSKTKQLEDRLDALDQAGLFKNAMAHIQGLQIYRMIADNVRHTIRLDGDLIFPNSYRYYSIRAIEPDLKTGAEIYYTGYNVDGVSPVLIDMLEIENPNGDGSLVRIAEEGHLQLNMIDGEPYVVTFYDASLTEVERRTYTAVLARTGNLLMTPDNAVATNGLVIRSNRELSGFNNTLYLYQHEEPVGTLSIAVKLLYVDGRSKDITYQNINGRLTMTVEKDDGTGEWAEKKLNITNIDTAHIDDIVEGDTRIARHRLKLTYSLIVDTENNPIGPTLELFTPIHILPNIYSKLIKIIPVIWRVDGIDAKPNFLYLGLYENGTVMNVSLKVGTTPNPVTFSLDGDALYTVTLPQYQEGDIAHAYFDTFTITASRKLGEQFDHMYNITVDGPSQLVKTLNYHSGNTEFEITESVTTFTDDNEVVINNIVIKPTHFRIWDIERKHLYTTNSDYIPIANIASPLPYDSGSVGGMPSKYVPVLIEFYKKSDSDGTYSVTNIRQYHVHNTAVV